MSNPPPSQQDPQPPSQTQQAQATTTTANPLVASGDTNSLPSAPTNTQHHVNVNAVPPPSTTTTTTTAAPTPNPIVTQLNPPMSNPIVAPGVAAGAVGVASVPGVMPPAVASAATGATVTLPMNAAGAGVATAAAAAGPPTGKDEYEEIREQVITIENQLIVFSFWALVCIPAFYCMATPRQLLSVDCLIDFIINQLLLRIDKEAM